jgi:hypothetical protein
MKLIVSIVPDSFDEICRYVLWHGLTVMGGVVLQGPSNQKFGLCKALMKIGAWQFARCIMDLLPQYSVVADESVAKSLCELIHSAVEPLYKE